MRKREEKNLTARGAYKSLKVKLWAIIPMFFVVLAITIVGVWASQSVTVGVNGTISFEATDVYAVVKGSVSGTKTSTTFSDLTYSATSSPSETQLATWKNKTFDFQNSDGANYGKDIVMTITVQNLSERAITVKIVDTTVSTISNLSKTVGGAGNSFTVAAGATSSATITFSVTDKNKSVTSSSFSYSVILSDETYAPPTGGGYLLTGDKWKSALVTGLNEQGLTDFAFALVLKISFSNTIPVAEEMYSVSVGATDQSGTTPYSSGADSSVYDVICYITTTTAIVEDDEVEGYALTFYCPETIYAPVDSSYLFSQREASIYLSFIQGIVFDESLTSSDFENEDFTSKIDFYSLFYYATDIDLSNFSTTYTKSTVGMFSNMRFMPFTTEITNKLDVSNVTDFSGMFCGTESLEIDFSNFDITYAEKLSFAFCSGLHGRRPNITTVDGSKILQVINANNITNLHGAFSGCDITGLDFSQLNTTNVSSMYAMFYNATSTSSTTTITLNTSNVTDMSYMFAHSYISNLVLNFDTSNVTTMASMFQESTVKTLDITSFRTPNLNSMSYMIGWSADGLGSAENLEEIDISNFDLSNVTDATYAFMTGTSTSKLKKIILPSTANANFKTTLSGTWQIEGDTSGTTYTEITTTNGTLGKTLIRVS